MVVTCLIEFDNNPYGTYFAGQVVTGKVTLTANKPKQVRGVALKIYGYAETHWTESRSRTVTDSRGKSTTVSDTVHYHGHEDYIASLTYLLGSDASQSITISPGIHIYTFSCHIPTHCPSSFESLHGHIRYMVRVALVRPWKFDQTFTKGFTVLKFLDLNYESPLLRLPANSEVQKTYCCGPCRSDPMTVAVTLAQCGFVPGQSIPVSVVVTNDSKIPVEDIKVSLVMLVCCYSQTPHSSIRNSRVTVSKVKSLGVLRNCKKAFNYELSVPATPPSCLNLCRIIQIAYEVNVETRVKGWHANQVIGIPVTIGNVPLMAYPSVIQQQPLPDMSMQRNLPGIEGAGELATTSNDADAVVDGKGNAAAEVTVTPADNYATSPTTSVQTPWTTNSNIPPPSYEEAMHVPHACINADEKHDYGESDFAPRYPVFNIPTPTAPNADEVDRNGATNGTWL